VIPDLSELTNAVSLAQSSFVVKQRRCPQSDHRFSGWRGHNAIFRLVKQVTRFPTQVCQSPAAKVVGTIFGLL